MKKISSIIISLIVSCFIAFNCSAIIKKTPTIVIPLSKNLTICDHDVNENGQCVLALYDDADSTYYLQQIHPDSVVCYLNTDCTIPTLTVIQTYKRIDSSQMNRLDCIANKGADISNPRPELNKAADYPIRITRHIEYYIYYFTFKSVAELKEYLPESLIKKAQIIEIKKLPPPKPKSKVYYGARRAPFFYLKIKRPKEYLATSKIINYSVAKLLSEPAL